MTTNEALKLLEKLASEGLGEWPLRIMSVRSGVTFAVDVEIFRAEPYDGDVVWITGHTAHAPEWMDTQVNALTNEP